MSKTAEKRTLQSIKTSATNGELGCKNASLLNLEPDDIICDELHLLLRVMDILIQALINTAKAYDANEAHRLGQRSIKATEGPLIQSLVKTISECGVHFYVWEDKKEDELQWPSIMGPAKKKLLKYLPPEMDKCQPSGMVTDIKTLWNVSIICYVITTYLNWLGFQYYLFKYIISHTIIYF